MESVRRKNNIIRNNDKLSGEECHNNKKKDNSHDHLKNMAKSEILASSSRSEGGITNTTQMSRKEERESRECHKCMQYLTSALGAVSSKPKTIFRAMGVHMNNNNGNMITNDENNIHSSDRHNNRSTQFWEMEENGMGIRVQVPIRKGLLLDDNYNTSGFGGKTSDTEKIVPKDEEGTKNTNNMLNKLKRNLTIKSSNTLESQQQQQQPIATSSTSTSQPQNHYNPTNQNQYMNLSIQCQTCGNEGPEGGARAYVRGPAPLSIILCSNRLPTQEDIHQVLIHELVHVYDIKERSWDLTDCQVLARSEIRAAREAECSGGANGESLDWVKRFCVRNKAGVATRNMFPGKQGSECISKVFEEAMKDLAPFDGSGDSGSRKNSDVTSRKKESSSNSSDVIGASLRTVNCGHPSSPRSDVENEVTTEPSSSSNSKTYNNGLEGIIGGRTFQTSYSSSFHATSSQQQP